MSAAVLTARGLVRRLGAGAAAREVLRGVDITIAAGEFVALVGPSGSGKSTLLYLLGGLDHPDAGSVEIAGEDLATVNEDALAKLRNRLIGFVYQFHFLLPEFSALENVSMPLLIGRRPAAEARRRAHELLAEVGLAERAHHRPGALSGGEQQRVAVARALAASPRAVLADEPTGDLDRATGQRLHETLRSLVRARGLTVVVVTHNEELARGCDRVLKLEGGHLLPA
jgi:lipoprotein-releasing system ATP-binding protein